MTTKLPRRLVEMATVSALALSSVPPAWSAPPPIAQNTVPPALVGRVARINGTVDYHTADDDQWSAAALNAPVSNGDAFWTEADARLDLQVASSRLTLAPATELDIATLDGRQFVASEPQGETYIDLREIAPDDTYSVQTPRGVVQIAGNGQYDVVAGDTDHPTLVTVVEGGAQVTGTGLSLQVMAHQTASISGTTTFQGTVGATAEDAFLTAMLAEDKPRPKPAVAVPALVAGMTGCDDLYATGSWTEVPQYGAVWYPPVEAGWVPYRHGHWAYVAPWGWTWIDEAPWGFAPFHYGRWSQIDGRWGWIPVVPGVAPEPVTEYAYPVYAPALVSFIAGAAVGGLAAGSVGWVPLGPREPYYPPYRTNLAYVRALNAPVVQNVNTVITQTNIVNNRVSVQNLANRGAATIVPSMVMVQSRPIAAAARPIPAGGFGQVAAFRPQISPTAVTAGVTPAVARQFNFLPPPRPAGAPQGPAVNPALLRAEPGHAPPLPALRAIQPGEPSRPVELQARGPATEPHPGPPGFETRPVTPAAAPRLGAAGPEARPGPGPEQRPEQRSGLPAGVAVQRQTAPTVRPPAAPALHTPVAPVARVPAARPPAPEFRPAAPVARPQPVPAPRPLAPAFHPPPPSLQPPAFRPPAPVARLPEARAAAPARGGPERPEHP